MIIILIKLLIVSILGISSAFFGYFIDFTFNEGNIFDFYWEWLDKIKVKYPKLVKPLGYCNVCFTFWVSLFLFFYYMYLFNIGYGYIIVYLGVSMFTSIKLNLDGYYDIIKNKINEIQVSIFKKINRFKSN